MQLQGYEIKMMAVFIRPDPVDQLVYLYLQRCGDSTLLGGRVRNPGHKEQQEQKRNKPPHERK